jgi:hypothetical protein
MPTGFPLSDPATFFAHSFGDKIGDKTRLPTRREWWNHWSFLIGREIRELDSNFRFRVRKLGIQFELD